MCNPFPMMLSWSSTTVPWQSQHLVADGCGGGGGIPWQDAHVVCVPSTRVQTGLLWAPPLCLDSIQSPWQYTLVLVGVGDRVQTGAQTWVVAELVTDPRAMSVKRTSETRLRCTVDCGGTGWHVSQDMASLIFI